jgi:protein-tyrosine kinase
MNKVNGIIRRLKKAPMTQTQVSKTYLEESATRTAGKDTLGWVSPSYIHSRAARLNPGVIARNRCIGFFCSLPEVESYRVLRTQILPRLAENGGNTLMVTSALPGEGKTLTAINLTFSVTKEFKHTVLLVDCDLRLQNIHRVLGIPGEKGLVNYILDNCPVEDLIVWPGVEKMTLISGGRTITGSSEILGSPRIRELVAEMKTRYPDRYVIFDVPPVLSTADALAFAPLVDAIVVVAQAGKTPLPDLKKTLELLPQDKILGIVLNRHQPSPNNYYYPQKK